ncbi:biotin/lipoate A/B protein ligase family protein [Candidatus Latescibacterota bacterium]
MHNKTWRFLVTGKGSAVFNMSLDEALMNLVARGESPTTFRLYGWDRPSISIGYAQCAGKVLDLERCAADGIDVVRRPTGGRAVYHDDELAYSIVSTIDDPLFGGTLMETYGKVSGIVSKALLMLNADVDFSKCRTGQDRDLFTSDSPCFVSSSRFELNYHGKKLVGSAQRRKKGAFLQHGSILTGPGQENIAAYSRVLETDSLADSIVRQSTNLKSIIGSSYSLEKLTSALTEAFVQKVGTFDSMSKPTDGEVDLARKLANENEIAITHHISEEAFC